MTEFGVGVKDTLYIMIEFTNGIDIRGPINFFVSNGVSFVQILLSVPLIMLVQIVDGICSLSYHLLR